MPVFNSNVLAGAAGQAGGDAALTLESSVRFNRDDTAYLNKTFSSDGNRRKFTYSFWVKRTNVGASEAVVLVEARVTGTPSADSDAFSFRFDTSDRIRVADWGNFYVTSTARFRDPSAWYHLVLSVDTAQASNNISVYVNGVLNKQGTYPQNTDTRVNAGSGTVHEIGGRTHGSDNYYLDAYLADFYFIDGQALDPTSFGAFDDNGVWQAAAYSGTFGTNGFHLFDFANETTVGNDSSGNNNDFTANNISTTAGVGNDVLFDVPTNGTQSDTGAGGEVSGNYATWNPLFGENVSLSNGNLKAESTTSGAYAIIASTMAMTSGKWYMEYHYTANSGEFITFGISQTNRDGTEGSGVTDTAEDFGFKCWSSGFYAQTSGSNQHNYSSSVSDGDVLSLAFDADDGKLWVAKNGTWMTNASGTGDPANGNNPDFSSLTYSGGYFFMAGPYGGSTSATLEANFGARPWAYEAPSGFKALCTTNLPTPTIADGSAYFDTSLWTGNGTTGQSITGLSFSPDLVWIKSRSFINNHHLFDTVRGVNKILRSSTTDAESTAAVMPAFNSDGFDVDEVTGNNATNDDGSTFVGWTWDAGSSTVSNTDGDITSNVRANTTSGFSIVTWTGNGTNGQTVGHGLNAVPKLLFNKRTDASENWLVYSSVTGNAAYLKLNANDAAATGSSVWNTTDPTSSVFTISNSSWHNADGGSFISYCFADVDNYSKIGSYEGNGSTDGPFVYTGFKPAFLMIKNIDDAENWYMYDYQRSPYNVAYQTLQASSSSSEETGNTNTRVDILSNGFKLRQSNGPNNANTYLYFAITENPFQANGGLAR